MLVFVGLIIIGILINIQCAIHLSKLDLAKGLDFTLTDLICATFFCLFPYLVLFLFLEKYGNEIILFKGKGE